MHQLPLSAETIFNAIPFGLIFVEDGTIRHANAQAHTILRRLYLESTPINEIVPDYEHHLRHTVVVENVPALAHIFPMSATTQAVVVRHALLDLPLVYEYFVQTFMDKTTAIIQHLETLDQTEFNQDQQQGFQTIQRCTFSIVQLLHPFSALKHIFLEQQIVKELDVASWLTPYLESWQAQATLQEISLEVHYDQSSPFRILEANLHALIDELLTSAFANTPVGGQIKLTISSTAKQLLINIYDSGPHPIRNEWEWNDGLDSRTIRAWAMQLNAEIYVITEQPTGKTITVDISLPLQMEVQRNFSTLDDLLEHMPLPLTLYDAQDVSVWYKPEYKPIWSNQIASLDEHFSQTRTYTWTTEAISTSQPVYLRTQPYYYLFSVKHVNHSDYDLHIKDVSSLIETELRSIITHEIYGSWTPIHGFADLMRLGYMGAISPDNASTLAKIADLASPIRDTRFYFMKLLGRIDDHYHRLYFSKEIKTELENLAQYFDKACTERQIAVQLDIPSFPKDRSLYFNHHQYHSLHTLLENAIQAAPAGTQVTLRVQEFENGVLFQIHDQGAGIPVAERAQMYDFFWRNPHNYIAPLEEPRLGIGLALANIIVRAAGGWMKHEYDTGGTTCSVWLPWIEAQT